MGLGAGAQGWGLKSAALAAEGCGCKVGDLCWPDAYRRNLCFASLCSTLTLEGAECRTPDPTRDPDEPEVRKRHHEHHRQHNEYEGWRA